MMELEMQVKVSACNPAGVDSKKKLFPKEGWKSQEK